MRAIICEEPGRLAAIERDRPERPAGWVSVDIRHVGVCGTDFHIFAGKHPYLAYPRVMGHELSGTVAEPSEDGRFAAGDAVIVNPYLACGTCIACRKGKPNCCVAIKVLGVHTDGGMCERIVVPAQNLYPAEGLSLRDAAMVEFLAIGAHAVRRAEAKPGDRALVVGAGPIGLGTALFARLAGAEVTMMDTSEERLDKAAGTFGFADPIRAGADAVEAARRATGGDFYDLVFDATGNARAMEGGIGFVAHGGSLVFVSIVKDRIGFDDPELHKREMKIVGSRNALKADFETVVAAMKAGAVPVDAINTHRAALDDLPEAMPAWLADGRGLIKAVLTV